MGGSCHLTLWWRHTRSRAVFVSLIDFSVLPNSALECQTFTLSLMDTLTLKWGRYFSFLYSFLEIQTSLKSLQSNHQPSILHFFSLNISWSCWHFPKDWVDPAFLISERTPGWSCLRKSALSKWVLETRNIDYLISVRSQSASFPSLYSFPHPPTHPVLTLHQNAANTFAPSSNVGFWGTVGFKMHDATAESIISILYNEWKFNVQTWGFQPFH